MTGPTSHARTDAESRSPTAPAEPFGYQPALDGVRALAVIVVLAFHLELHGDNGGYLGVSVFFTLSGFLITRLLVDEFDRTGGIRLRRFYARRVRRLLPASLLTIAMVVSLATLGAFATSSRIRGSTLAALTSTFNWYDLLGGRDYAQLFAAPSPLAHFWSLAIEEQFYWLWPLLLLVVLPRVARHRRLTVFAVLTGIAAASAPLTAAWWSTSAAYLATWARAGEILVGAFVAVWTAQRRVPERFGKLALPALIAIAVVMLITPAVGGWAYHGGLPVFALATALLIVGLQVPSRTARVLSTRSLVGIGRVSYGLYLFHWPVIVWLTADRTGLGRWPLVALQLGVTVVLTLASYHLLEQPVRSGRAGRSPRAVPALTVSLVAIVGGALVLTPQAAATLPDAPRLLSAVATTPLAHTDDASMAVGPENSARSPAAGESRGDATAVPSASVPTTGAPSPLPSPSPATFPTTTDTPAAPATMMAMFGDSVPAFLLRDAAPTYDRTDVHIANGTMAACDGMVDLPDGRGRRGTMPVPDGCVDWTISYPATIASAPRPVDDAILVLGQVPMADRLVDDRWIGPCDGIDWYLTDVGERIDYLRARGVDVVFALPARPGVNSAYYYPGDVAERGMCVRDALERFLTERGVATVDLDEILCPDDDCNALRPDDGVHIDAADAPRVLDWLLDQTLAVTGNPASP